MTVNNLKPETIIRLNKWKPRDYQLPFARAFDEGKYKRFLCIWPRRSGKDICCFNLLLRAALKKVGVYFYCLPSFAHARKVIWDSITGDATSTEAIRFLDFIPKELVESTNTQQMSIKLINGSLIQLIGSDSYDTALVGTNPRGIIFSEFALADERAYQYVRPILTANEGWACFVSTPRGKNHLYNLYQIASQNTDWFCSKLTIEDTQHLPLIEIQRELASGELSEDLVQQEYYTSFDMGVEGAYYSKYVDRMRLNGQIGVVPYETNFGVTTFWDLGVRDSTVILFVQQIGTTIRIIDYYEKNKEGLEHYIQVLQNKGYIYKKHYAPHDIAVQEFGSGISRLEKARQLGLKFEFFTDKNGRRQSAVPDVSIMDGIEAVRSCLAKVWIDEQKCKPLVKALENYRQEYDAKRRVYKPQPLHNQWSHAADALRYMAVTLPKTRDNSTPEELERRYAEAVYGEHNANMPSVFRTDLPPY